MKNRVVVLSGPNIRHFKTSSVLFEQGVNLVGICVCDQKTRGIPFRYIYKSIKRRGPIRVLGQIFGRIFYNILNYKKDKILFNQLYDSNKIMDSIKDSKAEIFYTNNYSNNDTLDWLKKLKPDIFVVHTMYWVSKKVRDIPLKKIVIGGHPGLTPNYRGAHSAFWAVYDGTYNIGCSIFWIDSGVDTGDLIEQSKIDFIEKTDSYFTLAYKGMIKQAYMQAKAILNYDNGIKIPKKPHKKIPENSEFSVPTLLEYINYRLKQNIIR